MAKSIWKILGIKKTDDISEIKKAYAAKLKVTRPDQDPEGFQILRQARETAENWARSKQLDDDGEERDEIEDPSLIQSEFNSSSHAEDIEDSSEPTEDEFDQATEGTEATPEEILAQWLRGQAPEPEKLELHKIFTAIQNLDLTSRQAAEFGLLQAIQDNFEWRITPSQDSEPREFTPPANSTADGAILLLCDEFGWFENDRRISELLFWDAEKLTDQLRSLRDHGSISGSNTAIVNPKSSWKFSSALIWLALIIAFQVLRACSHDSSSRYQVPESDPRKNKPLIEL